VFINTSTPLVSHNQPRLPSDYVACSELSEPEPEPSPALPSPLAHRIDTRPPAYPRPTSARLPAPPSSIYKLYYSTEIVGPTSIKVTHRLMQNTLTNRVVVWKTIGNPAMNAEKDIISILTDPGDDFDLMFPQHRWYNAPPNEHQKLLDEFRHE
jgi:hypothetical protein